MCNYNSQLAAGYFYRGIHTCTCILYIVHNKLTIYSFNPSAVIKKMTKILKDQSVINGSFQSQPILSEVE